MPRVPKVHKGISLLDDRGILRLDFKGSESTALPAMATAVTYDGTCNIILYSSSHICSKLDNSRAGPACETGGIDIDYRAETEQLLAELEKRLATCGSNKDLLVKLLLLLEGSGPFSTAGMMLEAVARTSAA
eukprot:gene2917-3204_t